MDDPSFTLTIMKEQENRLSRHVQGVRPGLEEKSIWCEPYNQWQLSKRYKMRFILMWKNNYKGSCNLEICAMSTRNGKKCSSEGNPCVVGSNHGRITMFEG